MLPLMLASQEQPLAGSQIHCTEDYAAGVPARDEHACRFAASAPIGTQRREEQHIGLVFHQQHAVRRKTPDSAANSAFFSRAPDPEPIRSEAASTRNPNHAAHGVSSCPRTSGRCTFSRSRAATARSSSRRSSRIPLASAPASFATIPSIPRSTLQVVPSVTGHAMIPPPKIPDTAPSSDRYWVGSHARHARPPSPSLLDQLAKGRAFVDTAAHRATSSVAFPIDDARALTNAMSA